MRKKIIFLEKYVGENSSIKLYYNVVIYVIKLFHGLIGMCKLCKIVKCNNVFDIMILDGLFIF